MRVISAQSLEQTPELYEEIAEVLRNDGLVCFPGKRQYSLGASLVSEEAVVKLVQSKRRSEKAPSLVLIPNRLALEALIDALPPSAGPLIDCFWPGQLTMMFAPSQDLPSRVLKTIAHKKLGKIGVRVPSPGIPLKILEAFGGPVLTSSANLSRKAGASSVANIKKSFSNSVDLLIDAGDIVPAPPSTVVDVESGSARILREGGIASDEIHAVLRQAGVAFV
jgi:L-threonylcarbamoyladenylate synthase